MNTARKEELTVLITFPVKGRLTDRQIDNRLAKLEELKALEKELKETRKAIEDEIQTAMGEAEHIQTGKYKVNFTHVVTNRFDSTRFQKEHPKTYAKYTREQASRRFSFSAL